MGMADFLRARLSGEMDEDAAKFISSLRADKRIAEIDIDVIEAHCIMLFKQGIISSMDIVKIIDALEKAREDLLSGKLGLDTYKQVDVHPALEKYVIESCGMEIGGKTNFGKSRNDQVMTDVRISTRNDLLEITGLLLNLVQSLLDLADEHRETIMPGYTHMQHAQATTFAHYLLSYVDTFARDVDRLYEIYGRVNRCPLGSSALAGTSLNVDRECVAKLLGFDGVLENNLDAISNRDFILEFASELVITMTTLSRMAADLITWSTSEFGIVEFADEFADVSSVMPQKKNPCTAEMIRAKTSTSIGLLTQLFSTLDGLSTGYNLDLQEMNAAIWNLSDIVKSSISVMDGIMQSLHVKKDRMLELLHRGDICALDLAELIASKGIPFREAHSIVGNIINDLGSSSLASISTDYVRNLCRERLDKELIISEEELMGFTDPSLSVKRRNNIGGPAPSEIKRMLDARRGAMEEKEKRLARMKERLRSARRMFNDAIKEFKNDPSNRV
jgi:argininosuccinate lyase